MKIKYLLIIALLIGGVFSLFASTSPDGLEKVAAEQNFAHQAVNFWQGLIPDYVFPGINNEILANFLTGFTGVLLVYLLLQIISLIINKLSQSDDSRERYQAKQ
ncbi:PDGLE domain-containing protein [Patescibacteria group bacterium]|nr:PDGLE domain-containing protein [Patescibacteria group bacterium]